MVKFLGMALVYCPGITCIKEGWQYYSLVDFQLGIKSDSSPFPDIWAKSAKVTRVFSVLTVTLSSMCTALERVLPRFVNLTCNFVHSQ